MKKVQKLAHKLLERQEESVRFSITVNENDNQRLEKLAELMGLSKSAFCSQLISAALDDMEEEIDMPESNNDFQLPSDQEYAKALTAIKENLTDRHLAMLAAHYRAKNHTITAPKLAEIAGYKGFGAVNLQYANIGVMLANYLGDSLPKHSDGKPFPTAFIVEWNKKDVWYCTLHPQVVKALEMSGIVS